MTRENLVLRVLTRLCPVVFMVLAAMVARADTFSVFSLDGRTDLSGIELYGSSLAVGDLLQVSNARGRTYDVTIARSKLSSSGNRSLSGTTEGNGTFVLVSLPTVSCKVHWPKVLTFTESSLRTDLPYYNSETIQRCQPLLMKLEQLQSFVGQIQAGNCSNLIPSMLKLVHFTSKARPQLRLLALNGLSGV